VVPPPPLSPLLHPNKKITDAAIAEAVLISCIFAVLKNKC
jgi:hypothetical protein